MIKIRSLTAPYVSSLTRWRSVFSVFSEYLLLSLSPSNGELLSLRRLVKNMASFFKFDPSLSQLKANIKLTTQTRMDMVSELTHPMVQKEHANPNYKTRPNHQTLKVMATKKARRRLSFSMKVFLLKWLESEFSSSVSSFTGTVKFLLMLSNDVLMFWFQVYSLD